MKKELSFDEKIRLMGIAGGDLDTYLKILGAVSGEEVKEPVTTDGATVGLETKPPIPAPKFRPDELVYTKAVSRNNLPSILCTRIISSNTELEFGNVHYQVRDYEGFLEEKRLFPTFLEALESDVQNTH